MKLRIAVPSALPGGIDSRVSPHFGHCDVFTIVEMEDSEIKKTEVIPNPPHGQGGCMAPVTMLANNDVNILIAGGMGMRPLQGFLQNGIMVFQDTSSQTVKEAIAALIENKLRRFDQNNVCQGHGHCNKDT